jgi:hypothetical protein
MTATETMIDAIRTSAHNIPPGTPKVAGYVTGSGVVPWTAAEWALFPHAGHVRIDQSPSLAEFARGNAAVADIEGMAGTVTAFVPAVHARIAAGAQWSTIYGTDGTIAAVAVELEKSGSHGWYYGHVDCWLADWNLNEHQAAALAGTQVHGLTCRAVQWASPSSNPGTLVPGSHLTLAAAGVDLSVAEAAWHAPATAPAPAPPPAPADLDGVIVWKDRTGALHSRGVLSTDGKIWS